MVFRRSCSQLRLWNRFCLVCSGHGTTIGFSLRSVISADQSYLIIYVHSSMLKIFRIFRPFITFIRIIFRWHNSKIVEKTPGFLNIIFRLKIYHLIVFNVSCFILLLLLSWCASPSVCVPHVWCDGGVNYSRCCSQSLVPLPVARSTRAAPRVSWPTAHRNFILGHFLPSTRGFTCPM